MWPCIVRFEASDSWGKVVLAIGHKCHQYCICIQLMAVSYCFRWNYIEERFQTTRCGYHDQLIEATCHQCSFLSNTSSQSGWCHQQLTLEMCCLQEKFHVRSANEAYMSKHVSRFSMKSDNMMTLLP